MSGRNWFIVGGAGFIGSHFIDRLLHDPATARLTIYDNFSSGQEWHYAAHTGDSRLHIIRGDVLDLDRLTTAMSGHDTVIHLASNPDIARAATEPAIDFHQGTHLTQNVAEASRVAGVRRILYASGSGVYGEIGETEAHEDFGPLLPVSTYGASKLAGESLLCSYAHMFGVTACAFRFGNVVGPRQTHGVGLDFLRKLMANPRSLTILGNGTQSKSYIYVTDVVEAVLLADRMSNSPYSVFNVATGDYITVNEIASEVIESMDLSDVRIEYTGGDRGWKGDVPIVRLNTARIRALGWTHTRTSRQAVRAAVDAMRQHFEMAAHQAA